MNNRKKPDKNEPPHFTGLFSGNASVMSYSFITGTLLLNKVLDPVIKTIDSIKEKASPKQSMLEEQELNEWYEYYKEHNVYPEFLDEKYKEKYLNLNNIFDGKTKTIVYTEAYSKKMQEKNNFLNSGTLFFWASNNDSKSIVNVLNKDCIENIIKVANIKL